MGERIAELPHDHGDSMAGGTLLLPFDKAIITLSLPTATPSSNSLRNPNTLMNQFVLRRGSRTASPK